MSEVLLSEITDEVLFKEECRRRLVKASDEDLEKELTRRNEEKWASGKSTDPIERYIDVDAMMQDRIPVSDPVEIVVGNKTYSVVFRELGTKQAQDAETFAEGYIKKLNAEADLPYEHINSPVAQDRIADEKLTRQIHAYCLKPGQWPPAPAFDLGYLRKRLTDREKAEIFRKYEVWWHRERIAEEELPKDLFEQIVEQIKKNGHQVSTWIAFDWITLVNFVRTSVSHPEWLQTDNVKDISS